ncbi:transketolase C-terminal domain-containing protein [Bacillus sp. N9]
MIPIGKWEVIKQGHDAAILTFGTTIPMAMEAAYQLEKQGVSVQVVNARFIKPMDEAMLHDLMEKNMPILTVEEAILQGGFGSAVMEFAHDHRYHHITIDRIGVPDRFIEHGSVKELYREIGMTPENIVRKVKMILPERKKGRNMMKVKNKE